MKTLNKSSYAILGHLSKEDHSGYSLKRIMARTSDFYCSESNAQIYPVLKQLEKQQLVISKLDETSGGRNKRIFSITPKGLEVLMEWLEKDCAIALYREDFLLQLALSQHLPKSKLIKKVQHYRDSVYKHLGKNTEIMKHIEDDHAGKKDQHFLFLAYDHIKIVLEAKLKWCDKLLASLS